MPATNANPDSRNYYLGEPKFSDRIHAVLLIQNACEIGSRSGVEKLKYFNLLFGTKELQGQVMVTKMDKLHPTLKNQSSDIYSNSLVETTIKDLSATCGIQEEEIHPIINYVADYKMDRDHVIEYLALTALVRALDQAEEFINQNAPLLETRGDGRKEPEKDENEERKN